MTDEQVDGRLPYGLLLVRLRHEAEMPHDDSWVVPMTLGAVRTVVEKLGKLVELENLVTDEFVCAEDGTVAETRRYHVEDCADCGRLFLREPDGE